MKRKCWNCGKQADVVYGSETKKRWCAPGTYTTKGTGWCSECLNAEEKKCQAARQAEIDIIAKRKQLRAQGMGWDEIDAIYPD
jgi:hypothetical protein